MELQKSSGSAKPVNALKGPSKPAAAPKSGSSDFVKKIKSYMPSRGTAVDCAIFGTALYVIVFHGKDIADAFEGLCPNEEQIMKMMQEQEQQMMAMQQMQGGMM